MRAVVINLKRRPERLAGFLRRWPLRHPPEVIEAVDVPDTPALGCFRSHLQVLQAATEPVAVFEDDAIFTAHFDLDPRPPRPCDVLWLGGQHLARPRPVARNFVEPTRILRSHAYIAYEPQRLAQLLAPHEGDHVDRALTALPVRKLAVSPPMVGQCAGVSDINHQVRRRDAYWG